MSYRMPDGSSTMNVDKWTRAWAKHDAAGKHPRPPEYKTGLSEVEKALKWWYHCDHLKKCDFEDCDLYWEFIRFKERLEKKAI